MVRENYVLEPKYRENENVKSLFNHQAVALAPVRNEGDPTDSVVAGTILVQVREHSLKVGWDLVLQEQSQSHQKNKPHR